MSDQINLQNINSDSDEISLKELILKMKEWVTYLKTKYKIILLFSFIAALIGLTIAIRDKPSYKAILTFTLEEDKGSGGGLSGAMGLASSLGIDLGGSAGGAFSASNIIELMKSRLIVEKALLNPVKITNGSIVSFAEYYIQVNKLREA